MRFKFLYYFLILLTPTLNNPLLIQSSARSEVIDDKTFSVDLDYLKKLPNNQYLIGSGDVLSIIVSREYPELNNQVTIDGEGVVFLPKLGRVYVKDLTLNELNFLLNKAYKKYVKYPSIEIQILAYRPIKVLVEGEVVNPGLISLEGSMYVRNQSNEQLTYDSINQNDKYLTINDDVVNNFFPTVFDAIRQSGGITQFTDLSNIQVIRKNNLSDGSGKISTTLNFEKVLEGDSSQNIRIYDSDIIKVGRSDKENDLIFRKATISNMNPKFSNVFVLGRVKDPGNKRISRAGVLSDAVIVAGGTMVIPGPVKFIRYNNDGTMDKRVFKFNSKAKRGSYKNPYLLDGDIIMVGNSALSNTTEFLNELTKPINGIFSTYALIKMIQD